MTSQTITCKHKNKYCVKLRWALLRGKTDTGSYVADIDLWHCDDCKTDLYKNWHTDTYELHSPSNISQS